MSKHKYEYVVVDWGTWGVDVQLSSKIVVKDHLNVKEGDACSLQGTDPVTKRPVLFEGEVLGVFGTKKDAEKMVTTLVSPLVSDAEKEPTVDAPRLRREPKPSKKKQEELENTQECEMPKRKKARKELEMEKEPVGKHHTTGKEPKVTQKMKSTTNKRNTTNSKDTQDGGIILAANNQRVQNLLESRRHASRRPEVVEIEEVGEVNKTNQPSHLVCSNSEQPSDLHVIQSAVPADAAQIVSLPQSHPPDIVKSRNRGSNPQSVHSSQQRDIPDLRQQLSANKQSTGEGSFFQPWQSSNLSTPIQSPPSSQYKSASPVTPISRLQFSSPSVGSTYSASQIPSQSHFPLTSPQPSINSREVLSPPTIPQQEFSISQSLSHCSDFDVTDLEGPMSYTTLHQLQTVGGCISRENSWQGMPSFPNVSNPCPNCQPLLQSLSNRLSSLEAEVEKLRRKQRKGKVVSEHEVSEKEDQNEERYNGHTKEALLKSIEDASDAKSAVEALGKQLFTTDELLNSSVTGFQCNKDYQSRPGLSPSRRSLLERIVLKRGFLSATRSSVRKDLNLLLKKCRATCNKESNNAKFKNGQEQRKL